MYFRASLLSALALFIGLLSYSFMALGRFDLQDQIAYQKIMQRDEASEAGMDAYTSKQYRIGLQKDVFFIENDIYRQLRLLSEHADLAFERCDGLLEVVEQMNNVKCYMQEELFYLMPNGLEVLVGADGQLHFRGGNSQNAPSWTDLESPDVIPMQRILFLKAATATYFYEDDLFTAENVQMSRYLALGHSLEGEATEWELLSDGIAKYVEFSLAGKGLNLKASQIKAKLYNPGRL